MGIFSKRMNKVGGMAGMSVGLLFTFSYIVYFQFLGGTEEQYLWGITPEGIGFIGMILNFVVSFIVCTFTPRPPEEVVSMVEKIRSPEILINN